MKTKISLGDYAREISKSTSIQEQNEIHARAFETIQRKLSEISTEVGLSETRRAKVTVRQDNIFVDVPIDPAMPNVNYDIVPKLIVLDPVTGNLIVASSTPVYESRKRNLCQVFCSTKGTLQVSIVPFK